MHFIYLEDYKAPRCQNKPCTFVGIWTLSDFNFQQMRTLLCKGN